MELTGGADCCALVGDEKSERVAEEVVSGGSVRVERWVRSALGVSNVIEIDELCYMHLGCSGLGWEQS